MKNREQKKLEEKWEKTLSRYGLGTKQPMTDNSEGDLAEAPEFKVKHPGQGKIDGLIKLRQKLDGDDAFMGGHQVTKIRNREREVPEWTLSDKKVQDILLKSFPKLKTNPRHRARAGRWVRVIYLYWRMKLPEQIVAKEMGISEVRLTRLIQSISYVGKGLNAVGKPRKNSLSPSEQPLREPERKDGKRI